MVVEHFCKSFYNHMRDTDSKEISMIKLVIEKERNRYGILGYL